jgi:DNA-binding HxlR family transcriptional regulator
MATNANGERLPTLAELLANPAMHDRTCKARQILDRVGDKWSLSVIHRLGHETVRFTELRRDVPGISQRMLTATLRALERDGLVSRTVHPVVPPRVDYALTAMGKTLLSTVCSLMAWADDHADEIDAAREEYDQRKAAEAAADESSRPVRAPTPGLR